MKCAECHRTVTKHPVEHDGRIYGPTCARELRLTGRHWVWRKPRAVTVSSFARPVRANTKQASGAVTANAATTAVTVMEGQLALFDEDGRTGLDDG